MEYIPDRARAEESVDALRAAGFRNTDISALFPENQGTKDFAHEKNTKAPEGADHRRGVRRSGWRGSRLVGRYRGIGDSRRWPSDRRRSYHGRARRHRRIGVGGIVGALVGMGMPEYEAKRYEGRIKHGGILVSVHADNADWVKRAKDILGTLARKISRPRRKIRGFRKERAADARGNTSGCAGGHASDYLDL